MELIAVSVGKTRAVQIGGEPVETAYLKSPLALPCSIGHNGLDGNETAVHPDPVYDEAQIVFRKSGRSMMWRSSDSGTILEAAQLLGLDLPFSCRTGFCQTCACRVIEGTVQYEFAPASRPRTGYALPCCARPGSAVLVLDA
jgi:ferredoxin